MTKDKPEKFEVRIWQEKDGYWIASVHIKHHGIHHTQGRTYEEVWDMVGDLVLTMKDVKVSWWNKLLWRLHKYE